MTTILVKRGTTEKIAAYTGECGELVFDTEAKNLYVMDGQTVGGIALGSSGGDVDGGVLEQPVETHTLSISLYVSSAIDGTAYVYDSAGNLLGELTQSNREDNVIQLQYTSNDTNVSAVVHVPSYNDVLLGSSTAPRVNCYTDKGETTYNSGSTGGDITIYVTDTSQDALIKLWIMID